MTVEDQKYEVLELCSEGDWPSHSFWVSRPKTEEVAGVIVEAISQLVADGMLITLKHEWNDPNPPLEIPFDKDRLKYEVFNSIQLDQDNYEAVADSYLNFDATQAGQEEYKRLYWNRRQKEIVEEDKLSLCRVCKHNLGESVNDARAHNVICESCGIQYGYTDMAGGSVYNREKVYIIWRQTWLREGKKRISDKETQREIVASALQEDKI